MTRLEEIRLLLSGHYTHDEHAMARAADELSDAIGNECWYIRTGADRYDCAEMEDRGMDSDPCPYCRLTREES